MFISITCSILFIIFTSLGLLHFYWVFGGKWGLNKVIPTKENQNNEQKIPPGATIIVGLGLSLFGLLYLIKSGLVIVELPPLVFKYAYWFIPVIFIVRAIGEFNYVGFFKKIKNTEFAKADSKIFSPLCLFVGSLGILIQVIS